MTTRSIFHLARRMLIILGGVLIVSSLLLFSPSERSVAHSPVLNQPPAHRPQAQGRDFIGLPEGNTIGVQNLLPSTANLTVTFALSDSTPISTVFDALTAESFGVYPEPANFTGQARVEATGDTSTGSLSIFGVSFDLSDSGNSAYLGMNLQGLFMMARSHTSSPGIALTWNNYLPLVMKSYQGWTTVFNVQNFNAVAQATVIVAFYDRTGTQIGSKLIAIAVNGSESFDLSNVVLDSGSIPDGFIGSAVIVSDQPVSPNSARHINPSHGLVSDYSGAGLSSGDASTTLYAPALFKASNLQTSELCIQNTGDATGSIGVSYTDGVREAALITPTASICLNQGAGTLHASGWAGGAIITGTQPLVAIVNVIANNGATPVGSWSYTVPSEFRVSSGAFALPLLLDNYKSLTTAIYLYNPGNVAAIVNPRYVSRGASADFVYCPPTISLPAHSMTAIDQSRLLPFMNISTGYFTATQPIAVAVGATSSKPLGDTDRHFGYEAAYLDAPIVPQTPCSAVHTVNLPLIQR